MEKDVPYWRRQVWARPLWVQTLLSLPPSVVLLTSWYSQSARAVADEAISFLRLLSSHVNFMEVKSWRY